MADQVIFKQSFPGGPWGAGWSDQPPLGPGPERTIAQYQDLLSTDISPLTGRFPVWLGTLVPWPTVASRLILGESYFGPDRTILGVALL